MSYKKIIIFIFLINISLLSFTESLILSNGKVFNGELFLINKTDIILRINNKFFKFSYKIIDYLIHNNSQEEETILIIEKNNRLKTKINLIKLTKNVIFYKNKKNDQINLILLDEIKNIQLETKPEIKNIMIEKYNIKSNLEINVDLENLIQIIIKKNKLNDISHGEKDTEKKSIILLNFQELDFYEKFWKKINNYIGNDTKNILWNLYELYSNKEKYLNLLDKTSNNENMLQLNKFNDKIIELRKEFYNRAKKVIYSNEILINYNMNKSDL